MDTGVQATTEGLSYAHSKGIAVVVMEPLKGGTLVNPPQEALNIINSTEKKRTPVDWALQFLWNKPEISVVLSGMNTKKMIRENCTSAGNSGINSLTTQEQKVIEKLTEEFRKKSPSPAHHAATVCPALKESTYPKTSPV